MVHRTGGCNVKKPPFLFYFVRIFPEKKRHIGGINPGYDDRGEFQALGVVHGQQVYGGFAFFFADFGV